jgi:hypothetical protein
MEVFPKGLNPFKIQIRFKLDFASKFCNSKSREIWVLGPKGTLSHLNFIYRFAMFGNFWS